MNQSTPLSLSRTILLLSAIITLTIFSYLPGLSGSFVFDDIPQIAENRFLHLDSSSLPALQAAAFSYGKGERPLSMLTFALNYLFYELDPFAYKLSNLLIHLANGLLLFTLIRLLYKTPRVATSIQRDATQTNLIALMVTAAWLLHPINVTTVLYVVQRMTALSALFCLLGMLLYLLGRLRLDRNRRLGVALILGSVCIATPLAFFSKENGILLPLYLFLIESLLFGFAVENARCRRRLKMLFLVILGVPAVLAIGFFVAHPGWILDGYGNRPFTLMERVLTEPRVLWIYIKLLLLPRLSELTLFHDDLTLSTGFLMPWTTLTALLSLVGLALGALLFRRRWPLPAFGILLFLSGHILESSVFALEIAHQHRNYLAGMGVLLVVFPLLAGWRPGPDRRQIGLGLAAILIGLYGVMTAISASDWSSSTRLALTGVTDHPASPRWQQQMAQEFWAIYLRTEDPDQRATLYESTRTHLLEASRLDPLAAPGSLLSILQIDSTQGHAPDSQVLATLAVQLPSGPVQPLTVTGFIRLMSCLAQSECRALIPDIERLLTALLDNPRLNSQNRGQLLAAAAHYALNRVDSAKALDYARAAVAAYPEDLRHHLNLARLLIHTGQVDSARNILAHIRNQDELDLYQSERQTLERQIELSP